MTRNPEVRLYQDEIIVDNFAGGGGASVGIEWALGRSPDIAINHDAQAVAMHQANHPGTRHYVEDVWDVDPVEACGGRPVGLAWFSPDCKHFSKAKGGKPVSKKIRGLAWIVVKWAKLVRPRVILLENVEEFQTWGPLGEDNRPDKLRKGLTFRRWKGALEKLGYKVDYRELVAADYGAPTTRKRLFLVARCDGLPIRWPEKTHDQHGRHGLPKWRAAAECIDWSIPCPSIFLTSEEAKPIGVKRPLADNTLRRIARGIHKFVLNNPKPFIVGVGGRMGQSPERPVDRPMQTITAKGDSALAVPVVAAYYGDKGASNGAGRCHSAENPLPTQTADPKFAVVSAGIVSVTHQGGDYVQSSDEPMRTITGANRGEKAVAAATVAPILTEHANATNPRSWSADQPLRTQCAEVKGGHFALAAATLVTTGYGERPGQAPRAPGLDKPLGTIVNGQKHAAVLAFLAKHNGGHEATGQHLDAAMSTLVARENKALVKASFAVKLKGTCKDGQQLDLPLATVNAEGQHHALAESFLVAYYGNEKDGQAVQDPMRTLTAKERLGLVMVDGLPHQIVDIGMRMLVPKELYKAQGFPPDYQITVTFNGKPLPKDAQVRMCGNSVSPYPCAALVSVNFADVAAEEAA